MYLFYICRSVNLIGLTLGAVDVVDLSLDYGPCWIVITPIDSHFFLYNQLSLEQFPFHHKHKKIAVLFGEIFNANRAIFKQKQLCFQIVIIFARLYVLVVDYLLRRSFLTRLSFRSANSHPVEQFMISQKQRFNQINRILWIRAFQVKSPF